MNIQKHIEFFNPQEIDKNIHIIGIGALGSTLVENLTRLGISKLYLYDYDVVNEHNIANQMFFTQDIGEEKVNALERTAKAINPAIEIIKCGKYIDQKLDGYVFMCVDKLQPRLDILNNNKLNPFVEMYFDTRMRLTDAQHYASKDAERILKTLDFTQEEADEQTQVSACGTTLSVVYTVRNIISYVVANFVGFVQTGEIYKTILTNMKNLNDTQFYK